MLSNSNSNSNNINTNHKQIPNNHSQDKSKIRDVKTALSNIDPSQVSLQFDSPPPIKDLSELPSRLKSAIETNNQEEIVAITDSVNSIKDATKKAELLQSILSQKDYDDNAPLILAAERGNKDVIRAILDTAKEVPGLLEQILNQRDEDDENTPLMLATISANKDVITAILDTAKEVPGLLEQILNQKNFDVSTPLILAAERGNKDIITAILDTAKEVPGLLEQILNQRDYYGYTPLMLAAERGNKDIITAILDTAKEVPGLLEQILNSTDQNSRSILHLIAPHSHTKFSTVNKSRLDCFTTVLNYIKDIAPRHRYNTINKQDSDGKTVLLRIMEYQSEGLVPKSRPGKSSQKMKMALLELTPNVFIEDDNGNSPANFSSQKRRYFTHKSVRNKVTEYRKYEEQYNQTIGTSNVLNKTDLPDDPNLLFTVIMKAISDDSANILSLFISESFGSHLFHEILNTEFNGNKTLLEVAIERASNRNDNSLLESIAKLAMNDSRQFMYILTECIDSNNSVAIKMILDITKTNMDFLLNIFTGSEENESPLDYAISNNKKDSIIAILDASIANNNSELLHLILEKINSSDRTNKTNLLQTILGHTNHRGNTPLIYATRYNKTDTITAILEFVKDNTPEILQSILGNTDRDGKTPLHYLASKNNTAAIKAILNSVNSITDAAKKSELLKSMLDPNNSGDTPLMLAAERGETKVITAILKFVNDNSPELLPTILGHTNNIGNTPLMRAAERGETKVITAILKFVNDNSPELLPTILGHTNNIGNTPFMLAVERGKKDTVIAILKLVKDKTPELLPTILVHINNEGNTPLMLAAKKGKTAAIIAILKVSRNLEVVQNTLPDIIEQYLNTISDRKQVLITIDRDCSFTDLRNAVNACKDALTQNKGVYLHVTFSGEPGVDAGALSKDFMTICERQLKEQFQMYLLLDKLKKKPRSLINCVKDLI